jgi:hypothetical protein
MGLRKERMRKSYFRDLRKKFFSRIENYYFEIFFLKFY